MKSKVKEFLVLPVICIILAICLAVANGITAPIIAANADKATNALREAVLPDAGGFEKIEVPEETMTELGGVTVHKAANGSGIAIQVVTKGYGGDMNVMVGIDKDGGAHHRFQTQYPRIESIWSGHLLYLLHHDPCLLYTSRCV